MSGTPQQSQPQPMMAAPQAYMAPARPKKPMSIWWPMGFLIAWVALSALGGGLIGGAASSYSYLYRRRIGSSLGRGGNMYYGGVACLAIGSICGITFWVLLIIWLVRRSRANRPAVAYTNNLAPAAGGWTPYAYPGGLAPAEHPQQPQHVYMMPHPSVVPAHLNKQEGKACASCGTVTATPYCPQCGSQI